MLLLVNTCLLRKVFRQVCIEKSCQKFRLKIIGGCFDGSAPICLSGLRCSVTEHRECQQKLIKICRPICILKINHVIFDTYLKDGNNTAHKRYKKWTRPIYYKVCKMYSFVPSPVLSAHHSHTFKVQIAQWIVRYAATLLRRLVFIVSLICLNQWKLSQNWSLYHSDIASLVLLLSTNFTLKQVDFRGNKSIESELCEKVITIITQSIFEMSNWNSNDFTTTE